MNITFLSRFQGKTATISKLGIEDTLKGSNDTVLYTNTYKSFGNMASRKFHVRKDSQEYQKQQASQNKQNYKQIQYLHLPSIGLKNSPHKNDKLELYTRGPLKGLIDKQTNWIIENDIRPSYPKKIQPKNQRKHEQIKENRQKNDKKEKKGVKMENRSNSSAKIGRLGGLGANIGSQQWRIRRSKQQKAQNYAQQLREIQRQKNSKPLEDSATIKCNLRYFI